MFRSCFILLSLRAEVGVAACLLQPAPFWFGGCIFFFFFFLLGRELGDGFFVWCGWFLSPLTRFLLAHRDAKGHYRKNKKNKKHPALSFQWQQQCCTDGCSASAARSFGDWQRSSSSLAHSSPSLNRCSKDEGAATDGLLPIMSYTVWDIGVNYSRGMHEVAKPRRCSA